MRKYYYLTLLLLGSAPIFAQDLRIPSTPAFSILDYEPASVMRPASTKKLSADILNSFDKDGKLLMNIGMEVMPYWLKSRPGLTRKEYLNPGTWQTIMQTFSLSAATVRDSATHTNNFGAGFRFQIVKGDLTKDFSDAQAQMLAMTNIITTVAVARSNPSLTTTDQVISYIGTQLASSGVAQDKILDVQQKALELTNTKYISMSKFCEAIIASLEVESSAIAKQVIALENQRTGFSVEVAGAAKFITETNQESFQKAGFWINANRYVSANDAFTLTARLMGNTRDTTSVNTDLGVSYIRQEKDFNVSLEGMMRWYRMEIPDKNLAGQDITRLEKEFTYRLAAQLSYTVAASVSVNISIGKDFDSPVFKKTGFFSIFGLNYILFRKQE